MNLGSFARWYPAVRYLLLASACAGSDGPTGTGSAVATIQLRTDATVQILAGDSLQLGLTATDQAGRGLGFASELIQVRSTAPAVATVSEGGLVRVHGAGAAWIVAEATDVPGDSVRIEARQPSGSFRITMLFAPDIPDVVRQVFEAAACRWEEVMGGELEAVELRTAGGDCPTVEGEPPTPELAGTERGVIVYVGHSGRFLPRATVFAVGGPCLQRALPRPTTILGQVTLKRATPMVQMPADNQRFIATHEMGHALGLVGLVQGPQPVWFDIATGRYTGPMGLEGYRRITRTLPEALSSQGGHWTLPVSDVMSGSDVISLVSI
ncbi:MAG TPA: hypothetical protein VGA78_05650, partial [Gemmatimonadales bacterium]